MPELLLEAAPSRYHILDSDPHWVAYITERRVHEQPKQISIERHVLQAYEAKQELPKENKVEPQQQQQNLSADVKTGLADITVLRARSDSKGEAINNTAQAIKHNRDEKKVKRSQGKQSFVEALLTAGHSYKPRGKYDSFRDMLKNERSEVLGKARWN